MNKQLTYTEVARGIHSAFSLMVGDEYTTVHFRLEGNTAAVNVETNGVYKKIKLYLPAYAGDSVFTRREADRLSGYFIHEACHVKYTDFSAWRSGVNQYGMGIMNLANGLEDARIESAAINDQSIAGNIRYRISDLMGSMVARAMGTNGFDPADKKQAAWICAVLGRIEMYGADISGAREMLAAVPADMMHIYREAVKRAAACTDTAGIIAVAVWLHGALGLYESQAPTNPRPRGGQSSDDNSGDDESNGGDDNSGDDESNGGDDNSGDDESNDGDAGDGESNDGDAGDGESNGGDAGDGESNGGNGSGVTGGSDAADSADNYASAEPTADGIFENKDFAESDWQQAEIDSLIMRYQPGKILHRYRTILNAPDTETANFRPSPLVAAAVRKLVKTDDTGGVTRRHSSGRFDRRAVVRMDYGQTNVFTRRWHVDGTKTAVSFLIDLSSSMHGWEILACAKFAYSLSAIMERAGGRVEVCGYQSSRGDFTCRFNLFKPFNMRHGQCVNALGNIRHCASGGTHWAPGIIQAGERLITENRDCTRRIMFALTDGACTYGDGVVAAAVKQAQAMGIEVIGIGLGVDLASNFRRKGVLQDSLYIRSYELRPDSTTGFADKAFSVLVNTINKKAGR